MTDLIRVERVDRIQRITLNRPDKMNSLTGSMYLALCDALEQADADPDVRVIYLCGEGAHFCAGNDMASFISSMEDASGQVVQQVLQPPQKLLLQLERLKKPLVAAVTGMAVGIGANIMLYCDFSYADGSARFLLPFVNLGLSPEGGCSHLLPRLMGHARAAELLMLGEPFSAETAAELGFINAACETDELADKAWSSALKLAAKPPQSLRIIKAALRQNPQYPLQDVILSELQLLAQRFSSAEAKEALTAFAAKRKPDFSRFS